MALAGYCRDCGQYVWLNDQWGCVNGHAWTEISNWYETQTGVPVTPYWLQPAPVAAPVAAEVAAPAPIATEPVAPTPAAPAPIAPAPAPAAAVEPVPPAAPNPAPAAPVPVAPAPIALEPSSRLELLADILATLGQYPGYVSQYGTDTDIVISNEIADANWGTGNKKVEYSAVLKAVEPEHTVVYWELIKESSSGLNFGSFDAEATTIVGLQRSGGKMETVIGPNGVAMDAEWDYGATRSIVESVVARHGWRLKSVVRKSSAQW